MDEDNLNLCWHIPTIYNTMSLACAHGLHATARPGASAQSGSTAGGRPVTPTSKHDKITIKKLSIIFLLIKSD